jgi:hypothetical protein
VIINQCVRVGIRAALPIGIIQLQGGFDSRQIGLADRINVFHGDLSDGIPKINIQLEFVLWSSVHIVLVPIGQERPGERIIAGIDAGEVKQDKLLRYLRQYSGRMGIAGSKAGWQGGRWKSGQSLGDDGRNEIVLRIWLGGQAERVKRAAGRKG